MLPLKKNYDHKRIYHLMKSVHKLKDLASLDYRNQTLVA